MISARLLRMENYLGFRLLSDAEAEAILSGGAPVEPKAAVSSPASGDLEVEIGEYWLARVGVLALSVGLAFLVAFPFTGLPSFVSCLIGYAASAVFFAASGRMRRARPDTAYILYGGALFLLFFATLRLHFFSLQPVVSSLPLGLALLVVAVSVELVLAARMGSELMTGLVCYWDGSRRDRGRRMVSARVAGGAGVVVVFPCAEPQLARVGNRGDWPHLPAPSRLAPQ